MALRVHTGTYSGTGVAQSITSVGFQPSVLFIKGGSNVTQVGTAEMGSTKMQDITGSAPATGLLSSYDFNGFTLGTSSKVNASGTTYYYMALGGSGDIKTGTYAGNATGNRAITGVGFQPTLVMFWDDLGDTGGWRSADMPSTDSWIDFGSVGLLTDRVFTLDTDGFTLSFRNEVNGTGRNYYYVAIKDAASLFNTFTFTGNGVDNRNITGVGFQPDFALIKGATNVAALRFKDETGDNSFLANATSEAADRIQSFISDGAQVGTSVNVNASSTTYYGLAFKGSNDIALQVSASTDDARNISGNGTFNSNNTTYRLGNDAGTDTWDGFRWTGVTVPQGATINSATLDLFSAQTGVGTTAKAILYGEKSSNAVTFANTTAGKPEGRTRTTASVSPNIDVATFNTSSSFGNWPIDVTSLVQEIVNQATWASGNALAIVGHDNGSAASNNIGYATQDASGNLKGARLNISYTPGTGTSTFTRVQTTDALLRKSITRTHATDTLRRSTVVKLHTIDSLLRKQVSKTHTTDALIRKQIFRVYTSDSLLRKSTSRFNTADALLRSSATITHTIDAYIRQGFQKTHTVDTLLRKRVSLSYSSNTLLRKVNTLTHTTDVYLLRRSIKNHTVDSLLRLSATRTHTTNSVLRKNLVLTHSTNTLLRIASTKSHTADVFLHRTFSASHLTDVLLRKVSLRTHTINALLRILITSTHTTNAFLRAKLVRSHTVDSLLRAQSIRTHTANSLLRKVSTKYHATDALLANSSVIRSHYTDGLLRTRSTLLYLTDALLYRRSTKSHTTDTTLSRRPYRAHTTDAYLKMHDISTKPSVIILKQIFGLSNATGSPSAAIEREDVPKLHSVERNL